MQIKELNFAMKSAAIITLLSFMVSVAGAQPGNAGQYRKPYMWMENDRKLLSNFKDHKWRPLYDVLGKPQADSFYLRNFLGMMKYFEEHYGERYACLHIYFCAYTDKGSPHVPKDSADKLTLVFAPSEIDSGSMKDLGYYHFPPDKPFEPADTASFKLPDTVFQAWHDHFADTFLMRLRSTIDESELNDEDGVISDTRAITYCREDIHELIEEQGYTHENDARKPVTISEDVIARFAAYHHNGGKYPKRLFVQFDLVDDHQKILLLENTRDFHSRPSPRKPCEKCEKALAVKHLVTTDNGQLCPPSVNCPGYKPKPTESKKK